MLLVASEEVVVMVYGNRSAATVLMARSADDGVNCAPDVQLDGTCAVIEGMNVFNDGPLVVAAWVQVLNLRGTASENSGLTWVNPVRPETPGNFVDFDSGYSTVYRNLITGCIDNLPDLSATDGLDTAAEGFRPQLARLGGADRCGPFNLSSTRFPSGSSMATMFSSPSTGSFFLPAGRDVGLAFHDVFLFSVTDGLGIFSAMLHEGGDGEEGPFSSPLLPGETFYFVGLSLDFSNGVQLGAMSDVQTVVIGP